MPAKLDFKKQLSHLYDASAKDCTIVDVPTMNFLMIDGTGDPNTAQAYKDAVEALYAVSYTVKFALKKSQGTDYGVMPLEGLWWVDDLTKLSMEHRDNWQWTMMIMQPEFVTEADVSLALMSAAKKGLARLSKLRFESFTEGDAAQIMHIGPYKTELPTIARLHKFIIDSGRNLSGKHHEIYLGDPRKTLPANLKTIIRQPFSK